MLAHVGSFILSHVAVRLQPPVEQPRGFALLRRNQPHDVFAEPARYDLLLDIGDEAVLVFARAELLNHLRGSTDTPVPSISLDAERRPTPARVLSRSGYSR